MIKAMVDPEIFQASDLDWTSGFVWVQRVALLTVVDRKTPFLTARHLDGETIEVDQTTILEDYFFIDNERYLKPRYQPHKSLCAKETYTFETQGKLKTVEAGGAILTRDGLNLSVVSRYEYERDYAAVAYPGHTEEPLMPFPDHE